MSFAIVLGIIALVVWIIIAIGLALLIGSAIRDHDRRERRRHRAQR